MSEATTKDEVRKANSIIDVVGYYVNLKRSGKIYNGLCPFHNDHHESLRVDPSTERFHCYVCNISNDIFDFIERIEHVSFEEALEILAKRVGIEYVPFGGERKRVNYKEYEVNSLCCDFFMDQLSKSQKAQGYLKSRCLTAETIRRFKIGYMSTGIKELLSFLKFEEIDKEAEELGVIVQGENGPYCPYKGRIIFPVHTNMGSIAGFGARILEGEGAKYVNSPVSDVYNKSKLLYGLYQSRGFISEEEPPILLEGYMDVCSAHQEGFRNCLAVMGTAFTEDMAKSLMRYGDRLILCYDSDKAGLKATVQASKVWKNVIGTNSECRVASLPKGSDPDDLIRSGNSDILYGQIQELKKAISSSKTIEEVQIEYIFSKHDLSTEMGKSAALSECIKAISMMSPYHIRDKAIMSIASLHPFYTVNLRKAVSSILRDVESTPKSRKQSS